MGGATSNTVSYAGRMAKMAEDWDRRGRSIGN